MRRRNGRLSGRQHGFSMIETLFVLIILGVVAATAMPVMERGVARSRADRAAATMVNDLRGAFSLAARQRKPVRILVSTANRTITVQDRATGTVFVHRNFGSNQSPFGVSTMTVNRTALDILPNGIATDTLRINFTVSGNARTVRMTRVGQLRMQ